MSTPSADFAVVREPSGRMSAGYGVGHFYPLDRPEVLVEHGLAHPTGHGMWAFTYLGYLTYNDPSLLLSFRSRN